MSERPRDELWDALTDEFGEVRTKSERGRRNVAVRELREAAVTPAEIVIAVAYCRRNFTYFTEVAVCNWIGRALHEEQQAAEGGNVRSFFRRMEQEGR